MVPEIQRKESTGGKTLPLHSKIIVFGDGVVGCPILLNLAKRLIVN